jgi:hypothetical protein
MNVAQLMRRVIEDGIASVIQHETDPAKVRGGVHGFELCEGLITLEQFESLIAERRKGEDNLRWAGVTDATKDDYWEYRMATIQVEWCYEILKVAHRKYPLSGRAVMKYQSILIEGEKTC